MDPVIRPGWGMGALRLGMFYDDVRRAVGEPDHTEQDDEGGTLRVGWHYDRFEFSLYFDDDAGGQLTLIISESARTQLGGAFPIGMRADAAAQALRELGALERDDEVSEPGLEFHSIAEARVGLLFADGVCESIDIAALTDEDGEYVWPDGDASG
jgi:hypothetical protein